MKVHSSSLSHGVEEVHWTFIGTVTNEANNSNEMKVLSFLAESEAEYK